MITPSSRAVPVLAGIATATIVVALGLWISGAGARLAEVAGIKPRAVVDAGFLADANVIGPPQLDDAGMLEVDAGSGAPTDTADVVDAGDAAAPLDAGLDDAGQNVDAGARDDKDDDQDDKRPQTVRRRVISATGPRNISWQGPAGEVYGSGKDTLRIPESVRTVVAVDTRRGGRTRIPIDKSVTRIDYAKLPQQELNIRVRPYAEVFLGKERLGLTPLNPVRVTTGSYDVRFVYGKVVKVVTVEVKANQPAVLNVVMTK